MDNIQEQIEHYLNLEWTLIEGTDIGYDKKPYHYIEIQEFPSFAFCAPTQEAARANYKRQLKLLFRIMLEDGDAIPEPGYMPED